MFAELQFLNIHVISQDSITYCLHLIQNDSVLNPTLKLIKITTNVVLFTLRTCRCLNYLLSLKAYSFICKTWLSPIQ